MKPPQPFSMPKGFSMKLQIPVAQLSCLLVLLFFLSSCVPQKTETKVEAPKTPPAAVEKVAKPIQLPVQYQRPSYMVDRRSNESLDEVINDVAIKVGASIRSTQGPQPLWDILKRLAALKKMSVSWASDVDQNVLVDVDISANDDFYAAIENLLRQVDYYHETKGSTIVVKYKETRQFHIAMPFSKQLYETATGGNVLGSNDASNNIEGTIRLDSRGNEFDIWLNIQDNMDAILDTWSTSATTEAEKNDTDTDTKTATNDENGEDNTRVTRQVSASGNKYTIDKPVGLITVHAPRPLLDKLEIYFDNLKRELYKQVSIEAKIIEVQLSDHSSIGLDWNLLLRSLSVAGGNYNFSRSRSKNETANNTSTETWDRTDRNDNSSISTRNQTNDFLLPDSLTADDGTHNFTGTVTRNAGYAATSGVTAATLITNGLTEGLSGAISLAAFSFDSFLNAVKDQGQTTILSNPKLSVLNGQPALLTVGRNVTYIDSIKADVSESGNVTLSANTERVLSGIGLALTANILDDKEIILNLVPVTSELEEPIQYRAVGLGEVGLPIINVREMSTVVKVKDGEMLVIGGLISSVDENEGTFVPGTSDIPFFKYLFGFEEKTSRKRELIILLKPRII
ncbi:MAG TPA: type II and III secretion system protein [Desulfobacterales bacterium]|nr:type II and III secretion system protein [Desulfobacterales bacterium]